LNIELSKQDQKTENVNEVSKYNPGVLFHVLTFTNHQINSLSHHGDKLNHLHHGQVTLPPNRNALVSTRNLGVHTDKVVGVHDSVNEAIQENSEVNVTII